MSAPARSVTVLGSTGSIGISTLDVLARHPQRYRVDTLSAHRNVELLARQCQRFRPQRAIITDPQQYSALAELLGQCAPTVEVAGGEQALIDAAGDPGSDFVVAAIVGAAGLLPTLAAARAGKRILLANKEALVMSGGLLIEHIRNSGGELLPLDSEHNAIFQCLPGMVDGSGSTPDLSGVDQIMLTASGGPFRGWNRDQLAVVSKQQALKHPNWQMGPKITIDSATLMNKGLEVIEACHLFGVGPELISVLVHPQSIVHSLVSYRDGSVLAQLGNPDMRTPIAHALAWPTRIDAGVKRLDLAQIGALDFEAPDHRNFPALSMAFDAIRTGGTAPAVLNAANEIAVQAFLDQRVSFLQLSQIVDQTLQQSKIETADDLETILYADATARCKAATIIDTAN